jgi:hypothetical protein
VATFGNPQEGNMTIGGPLDSVERPGRVTDSARRSLSLVDKTCREMVYITPPYILEPVREYFGGHIDVDPATEDNNPTGARRAWFTEKEDGLRHAWCAFGKRVFVNPPYGRELRAWVGKISREAEYGTHIVALLPGQRFETGYWQEHVLESCHLTAVVFIRRRVAFLRPDGQKAKGNPYGSMLYVFNGDEERAARCFAGIGLVTKLSVLGRYTGP